MEREDVPMQLSRHINEFETARFHTQPFHLFQIFTKVNDEFEHFS